MEIKKLPDKYIELWQRCQPILQTGRPDDEGHAVEVAEFILNLKNKKLDLDILIPVAIMHDIGHSAILPGHFKYITGLEKVKNGKIVHMLAGAKMAKDILDSIGYDPKKEAEIVDIISMHDSDQLENADMIKIYNTDNKKMFHDIDCMDRYNAERIKKMIKTPSDEAKIFLILEKGLDSFFSPEFKKIAETRFKSLKK